MQRLHFNTYFSHLNIWGELGCRLRIPDVAGCRLRQHLKAFLDKCSGRHLKNSRMAKAINYAQNHWPKLVLFVDDGRIDLDTNAVERMFKPSILLRKNALFTQTHCQPDEIGLFKDLEPYRTAWDAIGDLPEHPNEASIAMTGKWADLLPSIPEGQNYLWHTNRLGGINLFGWRTRYWSFMLKLAKDQPSWTIQAQPGSSIGPFHWKNRKLSAQEMCRLQTFPDGLEFDCGRTDIQKMLGNAVPSLLAEVLAREIRCQLLDDPAKDLPLSLMPQIRLPVPAPEPVSRVPEKYLSLVGNHADHPGTKKVAAG